MLKDKQGFYWISTINGLQRFDGRRMVTFQHDDADSASLPNNEMGFILMEDKKHCLWINTESGLCIYQPLKRNFKKINFRKPGKEIYSINSFFEDSRGRIWMSVDGDDLYFFDTRKNAFSIYTNAWPKCFARITSIAEDRGNNFYWLTTMNGLAVYDVEKKEFYSQNYNPKRLKCFIPGITNTVIALIYKDNNNVLWMKVKPNGSDDLILRFDIKNNELLTVKSKGNPFSGFITDVSGITWAFGNGLAHYDKNTNTFIDIPKKRESLYGIDFNEIQNMYEDSENNMWLMTDLGLFNCNIKQQVFTTYHITSTVSKLTDNACINGFTELNDGHIIALARNGDGLFFFDSAFRQLPYQYGYNPAKFSDKNYLSCWSGWQDSKGVIWIGCEGGRILQLDPATNRIITLHPDEMEDATIRSITEDKNGNIWVGTNNNIIAKWNRSSNTFKQIVSSSDKKYKTEWVLHIVPGHENDLWVTTTGCGLLHIDLATDKITEQYLPDNNSQHIGSYYVVDMIALNKDTYAIGTESGIDLFDWRKKTFTHITDKDGLPSTGVYSMISDGKNNLWFTSVDGISKIHLPDKRIYNYGSSDGITSEDYQTESEYKYANVARLKNNIIVFGNPRGFVNFNPNRVNENYIPSDVLITGFNIFNHSLSVDSLFEKGNHINLDYSQNYITIQYASLSNVMNNHPQYYYMLDGFDKEWKNGSSTQEAIYTYLPDGHYTFKVKCITNEGTESKNITSFGIYIRPPFYNRWWFYLLSFAFISSGIYFIYRQRINKFLAVEKIRAKVARDLHDDMGSVLSTINILSTMTKTKMTDDPVKASEYVGKIGDNSQRMMEAMDDIVWAIKPDNDNMQKITARMREFATSILESKDIEIGFTIDDRVNDIKLNMEARRDFFLIFKEAVNNVAKYSHCSKCSIHVSPRQHRLVLEVHDNGVGFDVTNADSGNGLSNMQKRAAALKGRLLIQSEQGAGTKVTLDIPL